MKNKRQVLSLMLLLYLAAMLLSSAYASIDTLPFSEGFENWNINTWTEDGTVNGSSIEAAYTGTYGLRIEEAAATPANIHQFLTSDLSGFPIFRCRFKVQLADFNDTASPASLFELMRADGDGVYPLRMRIVAVGAEYWWQLQGTVDTENISAISLGTWYEWEWIYNDNEEYVYAWLTELPSGETTLVFSEDNSQFAQPTNEIAFGKIDWNPADTVDIYIDDIAFSDTDGQQYEDYVEPEEPFSATGIAAPYVYGAITIMSLSLIIGVGAAFMVSLKDQDMAPLFPVILVGVGILITLFIALVLFSAFSGL